MKHSSYLFPSLGLLFFLFGCEVGPDYKRPELSMPTNSCVTDKEIDEFITARWWNLFQDPTLNKLEERALRHNTDLKQAIANVDEARAAAGVSEAELFPSIALSVDRSQAYASQKSQMGKIMNQMSAKRGSLDHIAGAALSYELDFFGKYRKASEAARAQLLSSRAARDWVLISVTAEVANAYFILRAIDAKLAIARRTLKSREESYRVYKSRYENGYCTELDYLRVKAELSSMETIVLNLEALASKAETALSVLIGCSPKEIVTRRTTRNGSLESLRIPSYIPKGIPSSLLTRRPDVLQAEGMLMAANAQIGVAQAMHFPALSLTGLWGFESLALSDLFKPGSEMWNLKGNLSLPIFNGGKISSMTDMARARYKKMLAIYEKTVQTAFKETLDAIVVNRKNREIVIARSAQMEALKKSYSIAQKQKNSGLIGLLDLLDVERGLLAAEMDLVEALQNQLNAVVLLCKALGGGWKHEN